MPNDPWGPFYVGSNLRVRELWVCEFVCKKCEGKVASTKKIIFC